MQAHPLISPGKPRVHKFTFGMRDRFVRSFLSLGWRSAITEVAAFAVSCIFSWSFPRRPSRVSLRLPHEIAHAVRGSSYSEFAMTEPILVSLCSDSATDDEAGRDLAFQYRTLARPSRVGAPFATSTRSASTALEYPSAKALALGDRRRAAVPGHRAPAARRRPIQKPPAADR